MTKQRNPITDYWLKHYVNQSNPISPCSLCGNSGRIDTRGRAISAVGIDAGRVNYCICPNGQEFRLHYETKEKEEKEEAGGAL